MLAFGANIKTGDSRPNIGKLSIADEDVNTGAWEFAFTYDQLDSIDFPKSGLLKGACQQKLPTKVSQHKFCQRSACHA